MTSAQLVMYVQNTGELYRGNCDLARRKASFQEWYDRTSKALPRYRREFHEPLEGISLDDLEEATRELKAYYECHIVQS